MRFLFRLVAALNHMIATYEAARSGQECAYRGDEDSDIYMGINLLQTVVSFIGGVNWMSKVWPGRRTLNMKVLDLLAGSALAGLTVLFIIWGEDDAVDTSSD
jgi:hypothetical protein